MASAYERLYKRSAGQVKIAQWALANFNGKLSGNRWLFELAFLWLPLWDSHCTIAEARNL
jgi:hypothetical protein